MVNRNRAPEALFQVVRAWLEGCRHEPSKAGGIAIPVRIIEPFPFKGGRVTVRRS